MARHAESPVNAQAAEWLSRCQQGPLAPEMQRAFEAWLDASPHHAVAYARMEATWERAQRLRAAPQAVARSGQHKRARVRRLSWAAAASVVLLAGAAAWWALQPEAYRTVIGQRSDVALQDGSRVELNTASELHVAYSREGRDVYLRSGEALFHVAHDPGRPFVVHAGNATVRAVGTVFNVRLRERDVVEVTVTEGTVAVDETSRPAADARNRVEAPRMVQAGAGVVAGPGAIAPVALTVEAVQQRTAWQRDLIELRGETLEQAVTEFNRYRSAPMVLGDPRLASIRVGGTFATDESDKFIGALGPGFGVTSVKGADGTLYLVPKQVN